ncbi:MAG: DUF4364 family protein [Oscillospiraceae bacterium]|nr:DUF4364 family protein [Oscillospiraceae bacterium]
MQRHGFIHDMMDVKVLILYVASRANYPMTTQEIYELCYQDECLSYFDICTAVPEMVTSGHLKMLDDEHYEITEKGRQDGLLTEDSVAFSVRQRAENAVARFNRQLRRKSFVKTQIADRETGDCAVAIQLDDELGTLMRLELAAPDQRQAVRLSQALEKKAELVYNLIMTEILEEDV